MRNGEKVWRVYPEYPHILVSNFGDIVSTYFKKHRTLTSHIDYKGYPATQFTINKKHFNKRIHRLVAETFIPNPAILPQVNHKDGNKLNNHISNLEWVTNNENMKKSAELGLHWRGEKHLSAKLKEYQVLEIRKLLKYKKPHKIAVLYKVTASTIYAIKNNKTWRHI